MEDMMTQFASLGAVGVIAYALFKNTLEEKREDRELFKKTVEVFMEYSKVHKEDMSKLTVRMENVEDGIDRTEDKVDKILERVGN